MDRATVNFTVACGTVLVCALAMIGTAVAQEGPAIVSASVDFLPYVNLDNPRSGTFEETVETRIINPRVAVNVPLRLGDGRTTLVNGIAFSVLSFSYRGTIPATVHRPDELYDLSYRLVVNRQLSPDWAVTAFGQPGIASDLENLSGKHVRFQGGLVFTRTFNPRMRIGFGGVVQNQFGSFLPLPAFNLNWRSASARAEIQLPQRAAILLTLTDRLELGLTGQVVGNHYRIGSERAVADDPVVKYSSVTAGVSLRARPSAIAQASVTGGFAVARRFEVTDQERVELREIDLEPGPFVRAVLEIRPTAAGRP